MTKYCEQFGFTADAIKARLALLGLDARDHALGEQLQREVIVPELERITAAFYAELLRHPQMRHFLDNDALIEGLKRTQKNYLLDLGVEFDTCGYFDERLRVGLAHARVGIPLSLYVCAYRLMAQIINDVFPFQIMRDHATREKLAAFVRKITTLDMSLAIETYHLSQMDHLEKSLENLKQEENQLRHQANTDALTGLANHAYVVSVLTSALDEARRETTPLCLVMADLDFFKRINDTYGHLVGDGVLREVAARLRAAVRDVDVVGRYGGEEFMVIFQNTALATAQEIAERVCVRVASTPIQLQNLAIDITISVGLAEMSEADTANSFMDRADHALYLAKDRGRNRVVVADPLRP
jgi:diguanylate cyclase (GGDEF)-like protein